MSVFKPIKCLSTQLSSIQVIDGQLIFLTDTNEVYLDSNGFRSKYGTEDFNIDIAYPNVFSSIENTGVENGFIYDFETNTIRAGEGVLGQNNVTAQIDLIVGYDIPANGLTFKWSIVTESGYDKVTLTENDDVSYFVNEVSGTKTDQLLNWGSAISKGTKISIKYVKDSSTSVSGEKVEFKVILNNLSKTVASKDYVDNAIFGALGGSY